MNYYKDYYCGYTAKKIIENLLKEAKILKLQRETEELKWRIFYDKLWKNYINPKEKNND